MVITNNQRSFEPVIANNDNNNNLHFQEPGSSAANGSAVPIPVG